MQVEHFNFLKLCNVHIENNECLSSRKYLRQLLEMEGISAQTSLLASTCAKVRRKLLECSAAFLPCNFNIHLFTKLLPKIV